MKQYFKRAVSRWHAAQDGQAIILVLILLVIGSLVLVPALSLNMLALRNNTQYQSQTNEVYTADSGIEDGVWRIKYDYFGPDYDPYNFGSAYSYQGDTVNGLIPTITIENVWAPSVTPASLGLTPAEAQAIIDDQRLVVSGTAGAVVGEPYHIKIDYDPADPSENLTVTSIGVWLPAGFTYTPGSSNLEGLDFSEPAYCVAENTTAPGGTWIVWNYTLGDYPLFTDFPGVSTEDSPMHLDVSFSYSPPADHPDEMPTAIAWVTTQLEDGSESPYPLSWDTDTRIYKITSTVGDTTIQAYSAKSELRQMGDAMTGEYVAIGNSNMINPDSWNRRQTLLEDSTTSIDSVPSDGDALYAYLYWTGWRDGNNIIDILGEDTGGSIDTNWDRATPSDWSQGSGDYVGTNTGGGVEADYLTLKTLDLSSYTPGSVLITWDQDSSGGTVYLDTCDDLTDWTAGSAWSTDGSTFRARYNSGGSAAYLTMDTSVDLSSFGAQPASLSMDLTENDYNLGSSEGLDYAFSADNGTTWSTYEQVFRNDLSHGAEQWTITIPSEYRTSGFRLGLRVVGFSGSSTLTVDNIKVTAPLSLNDGLDFAVSGDNGATWSDSMEAFRDDVTSDDDSYEYYLPAEYTTGQFLLRFDTVGLDNGQSVSIDNFYIRDLPPDTEATFKIDGQQVYYDGSGDPQVGAQPLVADSSAVLLARTDLGGYFYRCKTDVSRIVKTYPVVPGEEHHTGNASYTVGDVAGDTGNYLSHCGWSMILIYASPTTAGHYLYLRDYFAQNPGNHTNLDFDHDGVPGGDVTNFVIPEPIRDKDGNITETNAARITCFVGEGDSGDWGSTYTGDQLNITGQQSGVFEHLSNSASPWNDVWNSRSPGVSNEGIDVDTFEIPWSSGILTPGDTSLHLDMPSGGDSWTFIYLILSVRSEVTTGGTTHYIINRN